MRRLGDKLKSNLEARYLLLERMKSMLNRQSDLLKSGDISGCAEGCLEVDDTITSLKDRDYEIARLEMLSDDSDIVAVVSRDAELRNLVRKTAGITARNGALVDRLAASLSSFSDIRER